MKYLSIMLTLTIIMVLTGCSAKTPIQKANESESQFGGGAYTGTVEKGINPEGKELYRVFVRGSTGFVSIEEVRNQAEKRADRFCRNKRKSMVIASEKHSNPPHILGNWPRVELLFFCSDNANNYDNRDISKYDELPKLKKLLDDGLITPEEYKEEKRKILNHL